MWIPKEINKKLLTIQSCIYFQCQAIYVTQNVYFFVQHLSDAIHNQTREPLKYYK